MSGKGFTYLSARDLTKILEDTDIKPGSRALDIGCGTGQLARDLFHRGYDVHGIDLSPVAIDLATSTSIYIGQGMSFEVKDFEKDEIDGQRFDLVICKYVYAFITDTTSFLKKVKGLMKAGALFVIISPNPETTPPDKAKIYVDEQATTEVLMGHFAQVKFYPSGRNHIYICVAN